VIQRKLATLHELDTVYGVEDLQDLMEILIVEALNNKLTQPDDA
jgi:hypothetical protein